MLQTPLRPEIHRWLVNWSDATSTDTAILKPPDLRHERMGWRYQRKDGLREA
jgi:hypothetical protein